MVEQGITTAAAIHDGDPYTDGLATAFADAFEELGGTIAIYTAVQKGDTDMVPVLTEVAGAAPEAIFFPIFPPEGNFIVQQIGGVAGLEDVLLMAADGLLVDNFVALAESEGMYLLRAGPALWHQHQRDHRQDAPMKSWPPTTRPSVRRQRLPSGHMPTTQQSCCSTPINTVAVDNGGELTIDRQGLRDAAEQRQWVRGSHRDPLLRRFRRLWCDQDHGRCRRPPPTR